MFSALELIKSVFCVLYSVLSALELIKSVLCVLSAQRSVFRPKNRAKLLKLFDMCKYFSVFFAVFVHFKRFCIIFRQTPARFGSFAQIVSFCPLSLFPSFPRPRLRTHIQEKPPITERFLLISYKGQCLCGAYAMPMQYVCVLNLC